MIDPAPAFAMRSPVGAGLARDDGDLGNTNIEF